MATQYSIPARVRAQFPKRANRTIYVDCAWRPFDGHEQPGPKHWNEGWVAVHKPATAAVLAELSSQGFTWVSLQAGGVANPFREVPLAKLT